MRRKLMQKLPQYWEGWILTASAFFALDAFLVFLSRDMWGPLQTIYRLSASIAGAMGSMVLIAFGIWLVLFCSEDKK